MVSTMDDEQSKLLKSKGKQSREVEERKEDIQEPSPQRGLKSLIFAYIMLLLLAIVYTVAIASAQITGGRTSMFEINFFRFGLQTIFAASCLLAFSQNPAKIAMKDMHKLVIGVGCNYILVTTFYIAAILLPVGNMDAIYGGCYIILTTGIDLYRKQISKHSIPASVLALAGLIMLTQIWKKGEEDSTTKGIAPCDYMHNHSIFPEHIISANYSNSSTIVDIAGRTQTFRNELLIGYILVLCAAFCSTVSGNMYRSLLQSYSNYIVLFWAGLSQCILSAAVMTGQKYLSHGHLSLPIGAICLSFTILLILTATLTTIFANIVYKFLPISKVAISTPFTTLLLYFIQRTLLKQFHPGNHNILEIMGIVCIFCAGILSPVMTIIFEQT